MKIGELNCWSCTWFENDRLVTVDDYVENKTSFFVFGKGASCQYLLVTRGDVGDVLLREKLDSFDPYEHLVSRDFIPLNVNDDMFSIPYIGKQEKYGLLFDGDHRPCGVIMDIQNIYSLHYNLQMGIYRRDLAIGFYKRIIDNMEEEIFIVDEYGFVQFLNPYAEKVCDVKLRDVIGLHVDDLEKKGIISSSISKEVFRYGHTCNRMMELKTGKTVLATGIPIYDDGGTLINVLATSKNLEQMRNVLSHLSEITSELGEKEKEITQLRHRIITNEDYVIESPAMREAERDIEKVAPTDATVLIYGESGVGKEVAADLIYKLSARRENPMVKINCAMIPEHLLESEFFGYEPGAFTGASRSGKKGKIEMANGGTLFLDEIGEMPLALQAKILEVLQDREIVRVGGMKRIPVDVRFIAATNRDLKAMVREGTFRKDLYYRLNVMTVYLAPLNQRKEDILPLCDLFLKKYNSRYKKNHIFAPSVLSFFLKYDWPGNVRELMHTIEHLVIVSDNDVISVEDVNRVLEERTPGKREETATEMQVTSLKLAKRELEISLVKRAYDLFHSSYKVAEMLGISQAAVMKILKRNGYRIKNGVLSKIEDTENEVIG